MQERHLPGEPCQERGGAQLQCTSDGLRVQGAPHNRPEVKAARVIRFEYRGRKPPHLAAHSDPDQRL